MIEKTNLYSKTITDAYSSIVQKRGGAEDFLVKLVSTVIEDPETTLSSDTEDGPPKTPSEIVDLMDLLTP